MTATATRTPKQDPDIRGNPYACAYLHSNDEGDIYLVKSASLAGRVYFAAIHPTDPDEDDCSCQATARCWHLDAARLMQQIERVAANTASHYATWQLAEMEAEDARLRAELADADSWLLRAQLGEVGTRIGELLARQEAA
jgi:hypothetical protein